MSEFNELTSELKELEGALASLAPAASGIDRDQLMYQLGRQSVAPSKSNWLWPLATAAMALVSATLVVAVSTAPRERVVDRSPATERNTEPPRDVRSAERPRNTSEVDIARELTNSARVAGAWRWNPASEFAEATWQSTRPARSRPPLRWGDRDAWAELLDEGRRQPTVNAPDNKESA